jgi:hypothetical protein
MLSRFAEQIEIPLPDEPTHRALLGVFLGTMRFVGDRHVIDSLAKSSAGRSRRDLRNLVNALSWPPSNGYRVRRTSNFRKARVLAGILAFKMINDPMNNLQIKLFEGPDSLVNFGLPKKFDEHLSLPRSLRRIRKEL